ncbi:uncharacterized protein NDAI_0F00800 [Naumovozyma dairenensis CBS 421]|uniref:Uncharacterized protein n=1 Tax=Naumovozyma dairenensis (strain ATCC 10597 / BCRC 20456 / CBS 421 / NBRC 0211 / NRRL Y-12639) TaxID=1071378 RepID=G0WC88_NAUDC|nr:hypothetical protein NDAI_0F00800 [Naumovozyma dairenensis CBS 421]CCD25399.1 hypothetical protein NDAI_0F00800 [Naumovozyma dairenensis CBS 421]
MKNWRIPFFSLKDFISRIPKIYSDHFIANPPYCLEHAKEWVLRAMKENAKKRALERIEKKRQTNGTIENASTYTAAATAATATRVGRTSSPPPLPGTHVGGGRGPGSEPGGLASRISVNTFEQPYRCTICKKRGHLTDHCYFRPGGTRTKRRKRR